MTEQEWLACRDPTLLLRHYRHTPPSDRTLRLFATYCCRRVWSRLPDHRCRRAVEVCERFAEGAATPAELEAAEADAEAAFTEYDDRDGWETAASAVAAACVAADLLAYAGQTARETALLVWPRDKRRAEQQWQCGVMRHLFGNPFRPHTSPASWPSNVFQLAEALYLGQDCRLPLSDALEEAGHAELAEHLRKEVWHPKGCWVIDNVTGKK